jgi:isoamylase
MGYTLLPGRPYPLGATASSKGTNFAIFSQDATRVDLCFFDAEGKQIDCIGLRERTAYVWHVFVRDIRPGQLYGYRIEGSWEPEKGHRFNYNKLLLDPYAKAISGTVNWKAPIFPYDVLSGNDLKMDNQDSADGVPKGVVIDPRFNWDNDCPLRRHWLIRSSTKFTSRASACETLRFPNRFAVPMQDSPMLRASNILKGLE